MSEQAAEIQPGSEPTVEPVEAPWAPSQEEWQQISGAVGYLAELEQQRAQVYQPREGAQSPTLDPFADDFGNQLVGLIRQELTPYQQFQQEAALGEAEERAMDILTDDATRNGEFDVDVARIRADRLLPAMQQRYGFGPKAAEEALAAAAAEQRAYEQQMYEKSIARYTNHIETLSGAAHEPGATYQVGVQQRTIPDYTKGGSVASRFFGQQAEA